GSEVLWPQQPVAAWYWLQRPNYLSLYQTAGIVFSRETAMEAYRRSAIAAPLLPRELGDWAPQANMDLPLQQKLPFVCTSGEIDFVVSGHDLGPPPIASIALYPRQPQVRLKLYRCADAARG